MAEIVTGTLEFRNLALTGATLSGQFTTTPGPKNCTITFTSGADTLGTYILSGYGTTWNDFSCTLSSIPSSFDAVAYWTDSSDATPGITYTATIQINQGDIMANKIVQLQNKDGDNIYPLAGGMAADSISTNMLEDGAVTSSKISWATIRTTLYEDATGWNGETLTLSDSVANYDEIEFYYRTVDNTYGSSKIPNADGKKLSVLACYVSGTAQGNIKYRNVSISGNTLTRTGYGEQSGASWGTSNNSWIIKVVGIKYA